MGLIQHLSRFLGLSGSPAHAAPSCAAASPPLTPRVGAATPEQRPRLPDPPVAAHPVPAPALATSAMPGQHSQAAQGLGLMVHREEMLDRRDRLAGYRFSCDWLAHGQRVTPEQYLNALLACQVRQQAERRLAIIEVPLSENLAQAWVDVLANHTVFHVRLPFHHPLDASQEEALRGLRASGAGLALSWAELGDITSPLLSLATHCLVDFASMSVEQLEHVLSRLHARHPTVHLMVENVPSWPERRLCVANAAELALGRFLTTPDRQEGGERLTDSRLVLLELLNLVRQDGEVQDLANMAKRDPGIAVHLLGMANTPAYGLRRPLSSIEEAITLLGREALYRWLAISVFRLGKEPARDEALLEVALARAKFLELAASRADSRQQADELFLVGLLSLIDALIGMPLARVLDKLSLPKAVSSVLLHNDGPYGPYLLLAIAVERCRPDRALQLAASLGLPAQDINRIRDEALLWAEAAVHHDSA